MTTLPPGAGVQQDETGQNYFQRNDGTRVLSGANSRLAFKGRFVRIPLGHPDWYPGAEIPAGLYDADGKRRA